MKKIDRRRLRSISTFVLGLMVLGMALPAAAVSNPQMAVPAGFSPVPVDLVYPPFRRHASADDALAGGRVVSSRFRMVERASRPWRIAFLFPHIKDPYWVGCAYGVISEARRLGVAVDIFPANGYDDLIGQLIRMDEVIAAKYDAIVISPISYTANNASIRHARAQGIPVFELANDSTSDDLEVKVTTSLKSMGIDATEWVIRDAQRRGLKTVNIGLLPGPADAGWVRGEVEGTREAAHKAKMRVNIVDIKYGDSDRIVQAQLAAQMLAANGSRLDYIIGCSGCAPAAILPVKEARLDKKIRIVAYDLTREIVGLIQKGEIVAAADTRGVSQARVVTDIAVSFLEGDHQLPRVILVQLGMVERSNFAQYDFDASTAPAGFAPIFSYTPQATR